MRLQGDEDGLILEVTDDGKGMSTGTPTAGMGLRTMAYRTHLLDGELRVTPTPAGGTRVFCRVPASAARLNGRPDDLKKD